MFFFVKQIPMEFYDPSSSSTSHAISCADQLCSRAVESSDSGCLNDQCTYTSKYGDETIVEGSRELSSSANVVFGTTQMGDLTKSDRAVNGIFGLRQNGLSSKTDGTMVRGRMKVLRVFNSSLQFTLEILMKIMTNTSSKSRFLLCNGRSHGTTTYHQTGIEIITHQVLDEMPRV
ncbi:putative aspartic peptidase A1 family, aspartic peptidase domain superfamily, xylanase inhibitor [Helianthus anomalus]